MRFANGAFEPPVSLAVGGVGLIEKQLPLMGEKVPAFGEVPQAGGLAPPCLITGEAGAPRLVLGRHHTANMMSNSSAP